jgi:hypothetical protein
VEKIQERKYLSFRDMCDSFCSSVINVNKAIGDPKIKKSSNQKSWVKKSKKGNVYFS